MIDTSSWKEFKLDELFSAELGDVDIKKEHINGLGIDVVTAGETKNGILGKSDIKAKVFDGNTITIDMFGKCTYRPDCYKMVTHARIFSLKCLFDDFDEKSGLYITAMLQKLVSGFNYSNMCSWNKIKDLSIKLPVKGVKEEINWEYMESYMNGVMEETEKSLGHLRKADDTKNLIDTSEWKEFRVGDLFSSVETGRLQSTNDIQNGQVPVISSSMFNNGILGYFDVEKQYVNKITVAYRGAGAGFVSYHPESFNATLNCGILQEKFKLTSYIAEFMCSILTATLLSKYDFKHIITPARLLQETIKLPVDNNEEPDWVYMEDYMKQIEQKAAKKLELLQVTRG